MKTRWLFVLLIPVIGTGQTYDSFSDGNFTENPPWNGDSSLFEVNSSGQLHLLASGSDTAFLSTETDDPVEAEWHFWFRMSFNTSSNNFARVYLSASSSRLDLAPDGIYLQAGGSDDSLSLIRQEAGVTRKVFSIKSYKTNHSTNTLRFKIVFTEGTWIVMLDSTGGVNLQMAGIFPDPSPVSGKRFGFFCRFTSSNASKFYFDDVYAGPVINDTVPPALMKVQGRSDSEIALHFSESLNSNVSLNCGHFFMMNAGRNPDSVTLDPLSGSILRLVFAEPLGTGFIDSLRIKGIMDISGNTMKDTSVLVVCYHARQYDILISEVLADPEPSAGLPEGEFIELVNYAPQPVYMGGWTLQIGNTMKVFPDITLESKAFLLIARDSGFSAYGQCLLLLSSSTSLPNTGSKVVLKNSDKQVIHSLSYTPEWYGDSFKAEGGWSLEMIDPDNPCGCGNNWKASIHPEGGTPGRINSIVDINPDNEDPWIERAIIADSAVAQVFFSETVDSLSFQEEENWKISPSGVQPVKVVPVPPDYHSVMIITDSVFIRGKPYLITFNGSLVDCSGNASDTALDVRVAIPDSLVPGCALVSEVLPDPAPGGERYVEIYNNSIKVVDISEMLLVVDWDQAGGPLSGEPLALSPYLLFPGDYLVVTPSPTDIVARYHAPHPGVILKLDYFPSMNSDSGWIGITSKATNSILDKMVYSKSMHYPLLRTNEGVSLERIDIDRPSTDRSNWFSAAESFWFGTPGYRNSHAGAKPAGGGTVEVHPPVFSPDNDGFQDILTIVARAEPPGSMINLWIFDSRGRIIRDVARNVLGGKEEVFYWDGINSSGEKAAVGLYIILAEFFHPDGTSDRLKTAVALAGRF